MDSFVHPKLTAVGYYGAQLQRLAAELQGLGYTLSSLDAELRQPMPPATAGDAERLLSLGGQAARYRAQLDHVLRSVEQLAFAAESIATKN